MEENKETDVETVKPEELGSKSESGSGSEDVDLTGVKPLESQGVDSWSYDKKEVLIDDAIVMKVNSKYNELGYQWVLKVQSEVLETLKREGEEDIDFRASELFNLIQDKKGKLIGFPTGDGSNLAKFLKDIGIRDLSIFSNLKEIIEAVKGKKALVKAYDKDYQGNTRTYLKFRY